MTFSGLDVEGIDLECKQAERRLKLSYLPASPTMLFTTIVLLSTLAGTGGLPCDSGDIIGESGDSADGYDSTEKQVLAVESVVSCCGLVDSWSVLAKNGVLHLQVWRPTTSSHVLLWTYQVTINNDYLVETISVADSVVVQPGDVLGWFAETAQVGYKSERGKTDILYAQPATLQTELGEPPVEPLQEGDMKHLLFAKVSRGNTPQLSGVPGSITRSRSEVSVGQVLFTVSASDSDPKDNLTYSASGSAALGLKGQDLVVKAPLSLGSHPVIIIVTDSCGLRDSKTVTVTVKNNPPVVVSLPSSVYVPEDNSASVLLHMLTSSDPDNDPVTCSYTGPHSDKFEIKSIPGSSSQGVYLKYPVTLNTTIRDTYVLSVSCSDGVDSDSADLTVSVVPNNRPVILNLPHSVTIESTFPLASLVYRVTATDSEEDYVTIRFSCPYLVCPFSILPTGGVLLNQSLVYSTRGAYVLDVFACDHRRCSDAKPLTIFVTDIQTPPSITTLPQTLFVPENQDRGAVLAVFAVVDDDGDDDFRFHLESSPHTHKITVDAQCRCIKLGANATLDYEKDPTSFVLTVTASDAYYSSLPKTLTVNVIDVNEAPVLSTSHYVISHREDRAGTELARPAYALRDPDTGDSHSYWLVEDANSPLLSLDPLTGTPSFAIHYDVDEPGRPSVLTFQVEIRDSGGLSTTATVTLSVTDVNDNAPDCGESLYVTSVAREATLGSQVFSHTVTDADSGANARLSYSVQHPRGMEAVLGVRGQGQLYLHSSLSSLPHNSFNVTVTATDGGAPPLSCSYGLLVEIHTTTRGFLELNMSWFVPFVLLLMLTGGLTVLYVVRYCCNRCREESVGLKKKSSTSARQSVTPDSVKVGTTPRPRESFMRISPLNHLSGSRHAITPTNVELSSNDQPWDCWNSSAKF